MAVSELKWTGMGEFNLDDHYIYCCGQESLRRSGVALIVNKRVWNAVFGRSLKNDRMILVCFPRQTIQHHSKLKSYVPTIDAKEAEVDRYFEDLQDFL